MKILRSFLNVFFFTLLSHRYSSFVLKIKNDMLFIFIQSEWGELNSVPVKNPIEWNEYINKRDNEMKIEGLPLTRVCVYLITTIYAASCRFDVFALDFHLFHSENVNVNKLSCLYSIICTFSLLLLLLVRFTRCSVGSSETFSANHFNAINFHSFAWGFRDFFFRLHFLQKDF